MGVRLTIKHRKQMSSLVKVERGLDEKVSWCTHTLRTTFLYYYVTCNVAIQPKFNH